MGSILPLLVALFSIPFLINSIGTSRFGVLSLAWMIVGYFSLFDLGLGRTLTKLISEKLANQNQKEVTTIAWIGVTLMVSIGVICAVIVIAMAPWLVDKVFNLDPSLKKETLIVFYILGISIPIVTGSVGLRGILEGYHRFGIVNAIKAPVSMFNYIGPVLLTFYTDQLSVLVLSIVVSRLISFLIYASAIFYSYPEMRHKPNFDRATIADLLVFGGWMSVSNIVGPLLLYLGRFFIIIWVSVEALAYFVASYEIVIKLLIISSVIVSVLFPTFSYLFQKDRNQVKTLFYQANLVNLVVMLPCTVIIILFAKDGLNYWINQEFAVNGFQVAQILVFGVFINSFGHLSQTLIQSFGRPDITAKIHIIELFLYIPYMWWFTINYEIIGAAIAWTLRVLLSTFILGFFAKKCISGQMLSATTR